MFSAKKGYMYNRQLSCLGHPIGPSEGPRSAPGRRIVSEFALGVNLTRDAGPTRPAPSSSGSPRPTSPCPLIVYPDQICDYCGRHPLTFWPVDRAGPYSSFTLEESSMRRLLLTSTTCWCVLLMAQAGSGQEENVPNGPWISSVAWLSETQVAGTQSEGLLLRPAKAVKAQTSALDQFEVLGETESSLWRIVPLPDGRVAVSDYRGGIHVFGGDQPQRFQADLKWVRAMALTPSGKEIVAGTEDGKLVVLSIEQLKEARRTDAHQAAIFDVVFNNSGDTLATACGDGSIKLFSWPKLEEQGRLSRGEEGVWSVVFTPDGQGLLSGGSDRRIQLWDLAAMESVCTIARTRDWVTDLVLLPDSHLVVAGCMDGKLVVADYGIKSKVTAVEAARSAIWSAELGPDGQQILLGTRKSGFALVPVADQWSDQAQALAQEIAKLAPPSP
ncbi:MAG: hypothetical protein D6753_07305 [Planctomycetota bacterium]|nr:MAG: hypothetical protein D6753_07305 [Planctomycetota bacterium]